MIQLFRNWKEVIDTCNLSADKRMDLVSQWLILTRACVFQMTATAGVIGGLLAAAAFKSGAPGSFNWATFLLCVLGLVLAHAANNLMNDYIDFKHGLDTEDYARTQYAPHPLASGLVTPAGLRRAIFLVNGLDALIGLYLFFVAGRPLVALFALAGLFISVFYVADPVRLKNRGLGELSTLVIWGPLMVGGTFYVQTGAVPPWMLIASLPYGLVVMTVLVGKHLDKFEQDKARGIHTLPVVIGYDAGLNLNQALMVGFFVVSIALVALGYVGPFVLLVLLALPRLIRVLKTYSEPKPAAPPPNYPVWPLWFVSWAFYLNKQAGFYFIIGLALNLVFPAIQLPWAGNLR